MVGTRVDIRDCSSLLVPFTIPKEETLNRSFLENLEMEKSAISIRGGRLGDVAFQYVLRDPDDIFQLYAVRFLDENSHDRYFKNSQTLNSDRMTGYFQATGTSFPKLERISREIFANIPDFAIEEFRKSQGRGVNKLADQDGNVLPDCFLMPPGTTALDFAYRLHTDFGKNFIKAINVRTKLPVAKDHELEHRSVVEIMSGK